MIAGFSITSLLLILLAGIGAGFVGYAVGASSLVSYPALLAFGIPPVLANASNTVGVVGTGIGGVMGARKELKGQAVRSITYVVIGAFGGAFLLLKLDPSVFEFAAPVLILLSSLIIAINPRGRMQAKQAAADATAQLKHIEATEATDATEAAKRATTPTSPPAGTTRAAHEPGFLVGMAGRGGSRHLLRLLRRGRRHPGSRHA